MRQIVFVLVFLFLGQLVFSQNERSTRQIRNDIEKNNADTQHPSRSTNVNTWLTRGKLFHDAYNVNVGYLRFGMPTTEALLFFREPTQKIATEDGLEVHVYSQIRLVFEGDMLRSWEVTDPVVANPLEEAISAYQKAKTLDTRGRNERRIADSFASINNDLETRFFNEFYQGKYPDAFKTALVRIEFNDYLGVVDTSYYFFAGFVAVAQSQDDNSMWQEAIEYLEKALDLGYEEFGDNKGQIYNLLHNAYMQIENPERALHYAQTGFEKYPEYTQLMYDLINYYLGRNENALALEYLEQAVARDPGNSILLFAKGKVLDELGETEGSIAAYNASIAIDPTNFDPHFNKAVAFFNAGVRLNELSIEARTNAEHERYKELSDIEFEKAIEPMLKAHQLRPDEEQAIETLSILYFRLRTKYPDFEAKYEEMKTKLEALRPE